MPLSPCKDCPVRHVGCHSDCSKYIHYREEVDKENKIRREKEQMNRLVGEDAYFHNGRRVKRSI